MKDIFGDKFGENTACRSTNVTYRIIGDSVDPPEISKKLNIIPSRSFAKGENYVTKSGEVRERPAGHWSLSTEKFITSTSAEKHARFLLEVLEPKSDELTSLRDKLEAHISIVIWWETEVGHGGFSLSNETMSRLSKYCDAFDFHFIG